ncbi:hypothetical protein Aph01nite_74530 [Acrocarpospora phusangensis]|uniref:EamA domain-containing protein n=1 Tax=Acrocarpospora phusangensis TaxID=1070424 RepID=A0A919QK36_9ACTN|nr:hypothetical protein Aph01nite_74530 [Acrocarpospora phusangensis]
MLVAITGALVISISAPLVRLAEVAPATSAFFRCLYAIPPLLLLAWLEGRTRGPMTWRERGAAWAAGVLFGLDLLFWHHAIAYVGGGLATVLGNLQVFIVAFAAWALLSERPPARLMAATPVVFLGVVLISGLFDHAAYGSDPALGVIFGLITSFCYAAFLLIMKKGSGTRTAAPLAHVTVAATLLVGLLGPVSGGAVFAPSWPAHGWLLLLALGPQVAGWALISWSLPRQPAALTALLLLIQPMTTVVISALVLGERPSPLQLTGCAVIVLGVLYGSRPQRAPTQEAQVPKTSTV